MNEIIFWGSIGMCVYVYFGYPLLLWMIGRVYHKPVNKAVITPSVSIIIAARNEEAVIEKKIKNLLDQEYPQDKIEIIIVSDGSTDKTEEIVRSYTNHVRLITIPMTGKAAALNRGVAAAQKEIIVFTDANALFEKNALGKLVHNFNDKTVGGVCGNQLHSKRVSGDTSGRGERMYWGYDKWVKSLESRIGSTIAADGAIYAIRKELFVPIADPAQADDMAISGRVVTQGYRLVMEMEALAYEDSPISSTREFKRKVRITNHALRAIMLLRALNPLRHGMYALELFSHKVLRYAVPFFLMSALVTNILLVKMANLYVMLFYGQVVFYGSAVLGYGLKDMRWGKMKCFVGPLYFCLANMAALCGVISVISGKHIVSWQSEREGVNKQAENRCILR